MSLSFHVGVPPRSLSLSLCLCLRSARRLFPSGVRWLFSSCLSVRGEVVITLFRYRGPQWNHCSAETIKHSSLNGRIAPQTLKLFAKTFTPHLCCFFVFFFRNSSFGSDFCLFVFSCYIFLETEVMFYCGGGEVSKGSCSVNLAHAF